MESLDARQHELAEQRSAIDQACTVHHAQIAEIKQELFTLDESVGVSSDTVSVSLAFLSFLRLVSFPLLLSTFVSSSLCLLLSLLMSVLTLLSLILHSSVLC